MARDGRTVTLRAYDCKGEKGEAGGRSVKFHVEIWRGGPVYIGGLNLEDFTKPST